MKVVKDNIWNKWEQGYYIIIPTNGFVKKNGEAVMGRGLALQASQKIKDMPKELGNMLSGIGNRVIIFPKVKVITFPVKHNWYEKADLDLIKESCIDINRMVKALGPVIKFPIYIPKVGCGNGKLNWKDVEPILNEYLDHKIFEVCDIK